MVFTAFFIISGSRCHATVCRSNPSGHIWKHPLWCKQRSAFIASFLNLGREERRGGKQWKEREGRPSWHQRQREKETYLDWDKGMWAGCLIMAGDRTWKEKKLAVEIWIEGWVVCKGNEVTFLKSTYLLAGCFPMPLEEMNPDEVGLPPDKETGWGQVKATSLFGCCRTTKCSQRRISSCTPAGICSVMRSGFFFLNEALGALLARKWSRELHVLCSAWYKESSLLWFTLKKRNKCTRRNIPSQISSIASTVA